MAKYGFNNLVVEFDNSGGALVDISQHVLEINGINVEAVTEESHTAGDSWVEKLFTGLKKGDDVTIKGFLDDTAATGPHALFNAVGNAVSRSLKITYGGAVIDTVETIIKKYSKPPARGTLTKYEVVLELTGAVT